MFKIKSAILVILFFECYFCDKNLKITIKENYSLMNNTFNSINIFKIFII